MKYSVVILFLLFSTALAAQKKFEGVVDYFLVSEDSSVQVAVTAYYKKDKIKFINTVKKGPANVDVENETVVIDFKKAVIDRVKEKDKVVERESMKGKGKKQDIPALNPTGKTITILGHACQEYSTGKFQKEEEKDSIKIITTIELKFWYAGNLLFPVPDSLKMIQMIPLFTNGRLALGFEIKVQGIINLVLRSEAKKIDTAQRLAPSTFRPPKGYRLRHND